MVVFKTRIVLATSVCFFSSLLFLQVLRRDGASVGCGPFFPPIIFLFNHQRYTVIPDEDRAAFVLTLDVVLSRHWSRFIPFPSRDIAPLSEDTPKTLGIYTRFFSSLFFSVFIFAPLLDAIYSVFSSLFLLFMPFLILEQRRYLEQQSFTYRHKAGPFSAPSF